MKTQQTKTVSAIDGTETQVLNVSNQTVIAKKKGNKSIIAVKKSNKSSSASPAEEIQSNRELDDAVRELQSKMVSDKSNSKSGSSSPKKNHLIKLHVNLTMDNNALPFGNTLKEIEKPL